MGTSFTFKKSEHLTNHRLIDDLFAKKGKSIHARPLLLAYIPIKHSPSIPAQVLISVGKKKHKRAVDRNLIRRRIKEAYRLNKHILYNHLLEKEMSLAIAFLYLDKEIASYATIEKQVIFALNEAVKRI
jgi:ribonuclease P protein component